jgi:hypothetical protein
MASSPVQVTGFYRRMSDASLRFFVMTTFPEGMRSDWTVEGITGVTGNVLVTAVDETASREHAWTFDFVTDVSQTVPQGDQFVVGATLHPPGQQTIVTQNLHGTAAGFYMVQGGTAAVYFTQLPPNGFAAGWSMWAVPGLGTEIKVESYSSLPGRVITQIEPRKMSNAYVAVATAQTLAQDVTTAVAFSEVVVTQPNIATSFQPAPITQAEKYVQPDVSKELRGGDYAPLRDLNTGLECAERTAEPFEEISNKGFDAGAILSLYAIGPQERFMTGSDFEASRFNPSYPMHTNHVMYQRIVALPGTAFVGQTVTVELNPSELGDLMSNMYLQCTLPTLTGSSKYADRVGRALISQIDFMVNETVIETLTDDWYNIRDQLFLDADEQASMAEAVSGATGKVIIPLELFFCRRHSGGKGRHERLRRPYFPTCAILNQKIYIRIKFHPSSWFTNNPTDVEIIRPSLIIEEIKLTPAERIYYMNNPVRLIINKIKKESTLKFTQGQANLSLTASFPVQMISWFIRNNTYESTDRNYYDTRYDYGYTTRYMRAAVPLSFPSGEVNYADTVQTAKITLNNVDVLSTFQGGLYYSFKQPMEHGLSVPSKNIYMYSFGLSPKEYNQGGYINFSKLNSQTTSLQLVFNSRYVPVLLAEYNLNLFYYGYTVLEVQGGFARLPFV